MFKTLAALAFFIMCIVMFTVAYNRDINWLIALSGFLSGFAFCNLMVVGLMLMGNKKHETHLW